MIGVLIWLAGAIAGAWLIWHYGLWHAMVQLGVCVAWFVWVLAGAAWLGRKAKPVRLSTPRFSGSVADLRELKRSAEEAAAKQAAGK